MKNKLTIVKVGGFIFEDEYKLDSFLSNFSKISGNKILVHGGGKIASNFSKKLGIVSSITSTWSLLNATYSLPSMYTRMRKLSKKEYSLIPLANLRVNIIPSFYLRKKVKQI